MRPASSTHPIDQILNEISGKHHMNREQAMRHLGIDQTQASRIRNDKAVLSHRMVLLIHLRTGKPVLDIFRLFYMVAP